MGYRQRVDFFYIHFVFELFFGNRFPLYVVSVDFEKLDTSFQIFSKWKLVFGFIPPDRYSVETLQNMAWWNQNAYYGGIKLQ